MLLSLFVLASSRGLRTLHVDPTREGDCFDTPCSISTAAIVVRAGDTVIFSDTTIQPHSYPSDFSDLFIQLSLMNTTVLATNSIIDGSLLTGEMMWQITSHPVYTWTLFDKWTFKNFNKPIAKRQYTWSSGPYLFFRDCTFNNCAEDLFVMNGGTVFFENCAFINITGRVIKAVSEVRADFVDCSFTNCHSLFFHGSDASFVNCRFVEMDGKRGGAIYAAKTTLHVDHCTFANCNAHVNGGAIYIRDSAKIFESEIKNSCFINTNAKEDGNAIYIYLSHVNLEGNCYSNENDVSIFESEVNHSNYTINDKCIDCINKPPANVIPNDYTPVDTNKWYQFDDLKSETTIIIDEDDDEL